MATKVTKLLSSLLENAQNKRGIILFNPDLWRRCLQVTSTLKQLLNFLTVSVEKRKYFNNPIIRTAKLIQTLVISFSTISNHLGQILYQISRPIQ